MQRIDNLVSSILTEISTKTQLNSEQSNKLAGIKQILSSPHTSSKQDIYNKCVQFISDNVVLKQYQAELLFKILYGRYFKHYELLRQCACLEMERKGKTSQKSTQASDNYIFSNVQNPYIAPALSEAIQIPIKKGIELDPLYLD